MRALCLSHRVAPIDGLSSTVTAATPDNERDADPSRVWEPSACRNRPVGRRPAQVARPSIPVASLLSRLGIRVCRRRISPRTSSRQVRYRIYRRMGGSAVGFAQGALHVALRLALADRLALVEAVLAAARARSPPSRTARGKYTRVGTSVGRFSWDCARRGRSSSRRLTSSLRARSGSWLSREAGAYAGMWTLCSHSSPSWIAA